MYNWQTNEKIPGMESPETILRGRGSLRLRRDESGRIHAWCAGRQSDIQSNLEGFHLLRTNNAIKLQTPHAMNVFQNLMGTLGVADHWRSNLGSETEEEEQ